MTPQSPPAGDELDKILTEHNTYFWKQAIKYLKGGYK
jgi:hypothetical protein